MTEEPEYGYVIPPPMPLLSISSPETIQKCASLPLRPNDIFICSYPKSGTTWMQHILLSLLFQHQQQQSKTGSDNNTNSDDDRFPFYSHVSDYAPFFEIDPHWNSNNGDLVPWIQDNHARIGRRIFNTHLRFDMLPKPPPTQSSPAASQQQQQQEIQGTEQDKIACIPTPPSCCCFGKFIYIVRSPLDACVSFYHHLSHQVQGGYNGSFDDFFQEWLLGDTIPFGSWLDHVQSYTTSTATAATSISSVSPSSSMKAAVNRDDNNTGQDTTAVATTFTNGNINSRRVVRLDDGREFFFVTYEEMCCNLSTVVADLREFLDLADTCTTNDDELLQSFSFAYMKANRERFQPKSVQWKNNFSFLRKGVPGDAAMVITKEQQEQFQTVLEHSPLWPRLMDEKEEESPNENSNNAVLLLLSKIKRLLVTARIR